MKKIICIFLSFAILAISCYPVIAEEISSPETEITTDEYQFLQRQYCSITISGLVAEMSATLGSLSSTNLRITAELQKVKSGVYSTIETYTQTGTGVKLNWSETRLINVLATYRLKVTFTAGSETVVAYAYP